MFLKINLLIVCFSLLFVSAVLADDTPVFDLGEVVVTEKEPGLFLPHKTTEITLKDIDSKNARTVDEALDFISGVRVTLGQKNEPYVMMRGFNQDNILILWDGIPIASPNYGYVDLNQIPIENISKIKVIKNSVSSLYGANSLGGVINIISKKPKHKPAVEATSRFSDQNAQDYTLSYSAKTENMSILASGAHRKSDGFKLSRDFKPARNEDGSRRENSQYEKNSFALKLGLDNYQEHKIAAFFNYIDNEKGIPPHITSTSPRYWRFTEWKRRMLALACELQITDTFSVKSRVFYDQYDNILKAYDDASYSTQADTSSWTSIYDEHSLGGNIYIDAQVNDVHTLKGAFNFKKDVHKEQDDQGGPWETYEIHTYSFGLEDNLAFNEQFFLSAGSSFDIFDQVETYTVSKSGNVSAFNPHFGVNYFLTQQDLVYCSMADRTRFPTINQLYSNTSGNPNLKEQKNINYEIGLKHNFQTESFFDLSYFYNDVKDLIDRASKNDPFLNTSKVVLKGIESNLSLNANGPFFSRLGYTYLDARDKNPEFLGRNEEELQYRPKHKADAEAGCITGSGLSASILGTYHGRRYYYDNNLQNKLGGYVLLSAKISQNFFQNWQASIFIENILDRNYQEEEGYPQAGRNYQFSLKGSF